MKEHNANISIQFMEEERKENNVQIRTMIVNYQKQDETFNTICYDFYVFKNTVKTYIKQALTYTEEGFYEAAIECYSELIQLMPNIAHFYECRGTSYAEKKNYDCAKADFLRALEIDPNSELAKKRLEELHEKLEGKL
jgi:tetratricopeptide (TPR) repeat protein